MRLVGGWRLEVKGWRLEAKDRVPIKTVWTMLERYFLNSECKRKATYHQGRYRLKM